MTPEMFVFTHRYGSEAGLGFSFLFLQRPHSLDGIGEQVGGGAVPGQKVRPWRPGLQVDSDAGVSQRSFPSNPAGVVLKGT